MRNFINKNLTIKCIILLLSSMLLIPSSSFSSLMNPASFQKPEIINLDFTYTDSYMDPELPVLYFTSKNDKKIYSLNYETKEWNSLSFDLSPDRITYYKSELYVTLINSDDHRKNGAIAIIDSHTLKLNDIIFVDTNPFDVVVDHDGYIYVLPGPGSEPSHIMSYDRYTKHKISQLEKYISYSYAKIHPLKNTILSVGPYPFRLEVSNGKFSEYTDFQDLLKTYPLSYMFTISPDGKFVFNSSGDIVSDSLKYVTRISDYMNSIDTVFDLEQDRFFTKHMNIVTAYRYNQGKVDENNFFQKTGLLYTMGSICKLFYKNNKLISLSTLEHQYSKGYQYFLEIYTLPLGELPKTNPLAFPGSEVTPPALLPVSQKIKSIPLSFDYFDSLHDPTRPIIYFMSDNSNSLFIFNYDTNTQLEISLEDRPKKLILYEEEIYVVLSPKQSPGYQPVEIPIGIIDPISLSFQKKSIHQDLYNKIVNHDGYLSPDGKYHFINHGLVANLNQGPDTKINSFLDITFDLPNSRFFTARQDGTITIYDYNNKNLGHVFHILGLFHNKGTITTIHYRDSELIVVGKNTIKIFAVEPGAIPITGTNILDEPKYLSEDPSESLSVHGYYPIPDTKDLPVNIPIAVQFNHFVSPGVHFEGISLRDQYKNITPVSLELDENTLRILPHSDLSYNSKYTLHIPTHALASSYNHSNDHEITLRFETGNEYNRYGGDDRIMTSVSVSQAGWDTAQIVVLATSEDYPDALAAAPLAKMYHAPILLTRHDTLSVAVIEEIKRLNPRKIAIIGGYGAISHGIESALASLNNHRGIESIRIWGEDRYETSYEIAKHIESPDHVIVATGSNFPDALSAASYAAANEIPILLSRPNSLEENALDYIQQNNVNKSYILGGTGVLSAKIEQQLPNPERLSGKDRYETNFKVLSEFYTDYTNTFFATGKNFPDALAGSVLAGQITAPIVLFSGNETMIPPAWEGIRTQMKMKHLLGAEGVIPSNIIQEIFENH